MKKYLILLLLLVGSVSAYTTTTYTANGTYSAGADIHYVLVEMWGGGGGGGESLGGITGGGGGGGGGYARSILYITNSTNYTVSVGQGGSANSGNGGSSWFNSTNTVFAEGGYGGASTAAGRTGGAGGTNNIGQITYSGGSGGTGISGSPGTAGGGGGAAGDSNSGSSAAGGVGGAGGYYGGGNGQDSPAGRSDGLSGNLLGGGASGARCDGTCGTQDGGSGARGKVVIYESSYPFSEVNFTVRDANTQALIPSLVNITLQSNDLVNYVFNTTSGVLSTYIIEPGVYNIQFIAPSYPTTYGVLTVVANTSSSSTYYLDNLAEAISYTLTDTLGNVVSNATVTFSRNIGGSIVVFSQITTDFSGLFSVNLNPSATYSLVITDPTEARDPFYGTVINPNPSTTYNIVMQIASGSGYNFSLSDIYSRLNASYNNVSKIINVTFETISYNGSIDYFGLNSTYGIYSFEDNISSSPSGGIAYIEINETNLSVQNKVYVTFFVKKIGYDPVIVVYPFTFIDFSPDANSITGGLFSGNNVPSSTSGKAILATVILVIGVAGAHVISRDQLFSAIVGVVLVAVLSFSGMYPIIFGIMTVVITGFIVLSKVVR